MRLLLLSTAAAIVLSNCSAKTTATPTPTAPLALPAFTDRAAMPQQATDPYYASAAAVVSARAGAGFAPRAKNVIIFIGDGMGISTITAARIYAGQQRGLDGESFKLSFETLPHVALSRTYSHDYQVSDSASTATAMVSGVKTMSRTIGLRSGVAVSNCASQAGQETDSLFDLAERRGLATGIVSTARITHATPAAAYAESANRDWENDTAFGESTDETCKDIARQLVEWPEGDGFEVALGGGRANFRTDETFDPEYTDTQGARADERDLEAAWTAKGDTHKVIFDAAGFAATDFASDMRVLGLFEPSHMQYELDRADDASGEPSLADLTRAAITRLSRADQGYVLMVEGGRIDHAHHGSNAARALSETDAFDQAVAAAMDLTEASDTLIIVTADHSHTMTMAGYPRRNNPILGKVEYETGVIGRGGDGLPYTTLGYANGPGACVSTDGKPCTRENLSDVDTAAKDYRQQALVPMGSETHAGEDVAVFARGPGAELVSGVIEQNEIFHIMGYASGLIAPEQTAEK